MASFAQRIIKGRKKNHSTPLVAKLNKYLTTSPSEIWALIQDIFFNSNRLFLVMCLLLPLELLLNALIIFKIKCNLDLFINLVI